MAPCKDKARAAGVSASSFLELKSLVANHETEHARNKAASKGKRPIEGLESSSKNQTVWARKNKGVSSRAARDLELEAISKPTLDSARAALEKKAKVYDKLRKGKSGGLSEAQYDSLLVDFDQDPASHHFSSDSEDVDESLKVPKPPEDDDDPEVEFEDEFGRTRRAKRSDVPIHLLKQKDSGDDAEDDADIIRNPVNYFPVFEPTAERVEAIKAATSDEANPLSSHYDASRENRAKGAGFYQFSQDEAARQKEMVELKAAREETERTRQETGAVNLRPGEVEGMARGVDSDKAEEVGSSISQSRAMQKRKQEADERRRMLEAKRRKMKGEVDDRPSKALLTPVAKPFATIADEDDPFTKLEKEIQKAGAGDTTKHSHNAAPTSLSAADEFLMQLERDVLSSRRS